MSIMMDKDSGVCYLALVALYLDVNHNVGFPTTYVS